VLRSGAYILGKEVASFEERLASFAGARHAIGVSSGTDALTCALLALDVGRGDEVLVPAFGFVSAAEAVVRVGAEPVFVDIEAQTLGPDPAAVREARTERTRALIVMHLFGQVLALHALRDALGRSSTEEISIIEDAAQAMGARFDGRHAGTMGALGTLSFFPAKAFGAAGDAGAVLTERDDLADAVKRARVHGAQGAYRWTSSGGNYRLDALQAAVLSEKLAALPARLERRRAIGARLAATARNAGVQVLDGERACAPTYAPLVLRVERRDAVLLALRERGVDARVHYPHSLPSSPAWSRFARGAFPEAERATKSLVSIPSCPELTDDEVDRLELALREVL
jgi:dTDP-4-amino-4,6-dideoxygalactose transaminase